MAQTDPDSPEGEWLRMMRRAMNLTQKELAERTNLEVSYGWISAIERGVIQGREGRRVRPSIEIVDALANALQADVNEARRVFGYATDEERVTPPDASSYVIHIPTTGPVMIIDSEGKVLRIDRNKWNHIDSQVRSLFRRFAPTSPAGTSARK